MLKYAKLIDFFFNVLAMTPGQLQEKDSKRAAGRLRDGE
jgi:hypothetical protein